jgi:hypothetical protein
MININKWQLYCANCSNHVVMIDVNEWQWYCSNDHVVNDWCEWMTMILC